MTRPDWQLPRGVSRALWEYTQQPHIATGYDQSIANSALSRFDTQLLMEAFSRPGRLVDLGCGTGRHALEFAARGFDVLGVDLSREMLRQLQTKSRAANVEVATLRANLCDLDGIPDGSFDYAILMYATLGMIPAARDRERVVRQVQRLLVHGGRFALHVHNLWFNLFDAQGRSWLWRDRWQRWMYGKSGGDRVVHDRGIPNFQNATASGPLTSPRMFGGLRANGWIIIARAANAV